MNRRSKMEPNRTGNEFYVIIKMKLFVKTHTVNLQLWPLNPPETDTTYRTEVVLIAYLLSGTKPLSHCSHKYFAVDGCNTQVSLSGPYNRRLRSRVHFFTNPRRNMDWRERMKNFAGLWIDFFSQHMATGIL